MLCRLAAAVLQCHMLRQRLDGSRSISREGQHPLPQGLPQRGDQAGAFRSSAPHMLLILEQQQAALPVALQLLFNKGRKPFVEDHYALQAVFC